MTETGKTTEPLISITEGKPIGKTQELQILQLPVMTSSNPGEEDSLPMYFYQVTLSPEEATGTEQPDLYVAIHSQHEGRVSINDIWQFANRAGIPNVSNASDIDAGKVQDAITDLEIMCHDEISHSPIQPRSYISATAISVGVVAGFLIGAYLTTKIPAPQHYTPSTTYLTKFFITVVGTAFGAAVGSVIPKIFRPRMCREMTSYDLAFLSEPDESTRRVDYGTYQSESLKYVGMQLILGKGKMPRRVDERVFNVLDNPEEGFGKHIDSPDAALPDGTYLTQRTVDLYRQLLANQRLKGRG